jgi:hypothetical protein
VRLGVSRVLLCGYRRCIIDGVACYQLPARERSPLAPRGGYRVTVLGGDSQLGRPMRIRIRSRHITALADPPASCTTS